jgi:hypothetical protein
MRCLGQRWQNVITELQPQVLGIGAGLLLTVWFLPCPEALLGLNVCFTFSGVYIFFVIFLTTMLFPNLLNG